MEGIFCCYAFGNTVVFFNRSADSDAADCEAGDRARGRGATWRERARFEHSVPAFGVGWAGL